MNKFAKYLTINAAALMLLSVGAVQSHANAARRHYRPNVARYMKRSRRGKITKRNKKTTKRVRHQKRSRKALKRNRRRARRYNKPLKHRRYYSRQVLKPRYRLTNGSRALRKSGFVDGKILARMGYSPVIAQYIFDKYAPNDRRAVLPDYMNPRAPKSVRHSASYNDVNKDLWVKGIFDLKNPRRNTKNPQVYRYYPKLRGWKAVPHH